MANKKKTKKARHVTTDEDIEHIRKYASTKTDKELAEDIGCSTHLIVKLRTKYGIKKNSAKGYNKKEVETKLERSDLSVVNDLGFENKGENDIKTHFEALFKNTTQYNLLKKMYTKDEIEYYLQEFSAYISDVKQMGETINSSELRTLDQLIQNKIRMNRLVAAEKQVNDNIDKLLIGVSSENELEEEDASKVFMYRKSIEKCAKEWNDLNTTSLKLSQSLDVTREERVKKANASEYGILKVIADMQDKTKREVVERQAAMIEKSVSNLKKEWEDLEFLIDDNNIDRINVDAK